MTAFEAIMIALTSNLVLIGVVKVIFMVVKMRKK